MARPSKETDLKGQVLKRYEELQSEKAEIDDELKGLSSYLKAVGAVKGKRRGRPRRAEQTVPAVASEKVQKAKSKTKRKARPKKAEKSSPVAAAKKSQESKPKARRKKAAPKKRTRPAKVEKPVATEQPQA